MSNLLIKTFPQKLHDLLRAEAKKGGYSLKGYVIAILTRRKLALEKK